MSKTDLIKDENGNYTEIDAKAHLEPGKCPCCDSYDTLEYGPFEFCDNAGYYDYTCVICDFEGREWYDLVFSGHQIENGCNIVGE